MVRKNLIKASVGVFILLLAISYSLNFTKALENSKNESASLNQEVALIQAFNGEISSTYIERGDTVDIYATIGNFGDQTVTVLSLRANFTHFEGNDNLNEFFVTRFDVNHRTIGPNETFTATLRVTIDIPEADYNVTIFFSAENIYEESDLGALARNFYAAQDIFVSVVELGGPSNVILGVGITFAAALLIVVLVLVYGWLKEKLAKRKY